MGFEKQGIPKNDEAVEQKQEGPEKEIAWTIDGSPERGTEAVEMVVHNLEASGWSGERLDDIKKTLSVGIANTITYANHGDATKSMEISFSVHGAEDGKKSVEISLTGQDKAVEAPAPTGEEADLQGDRAGELFIKLPPGVDVTLFPAENRVVLKQASEAAAE